SLLRWSRFTCNPAERPEPTVRFRLRSRATNSRPSSPRMWKRRGIACWRRATASSSWKRDMRSANNQRSFVKIALPQGAVVWGASPAGKPVKPGQSPDGALLIPLEKAHAGEEATPFALEVLYLVRAPAWSDKGRAALALPALDLPISRTGVSL